jgi:hypothetical protein
MGGRWLQIRRGPVRIQCPRGRGARLCMGATSGVGRRLQLARPARRDYGWRSDDSDGLCHRRSWLGATPLGVLGCDGLESGGVLRASVSCEGVALFAVSVATSVAHTARCSWFCVVSRRGWRPTQLCGYCVSRPIGAPLEGLHRSQGGGDGEGCMLLPGVLAFQVL